MRAKSFFSKPLLITYTLVATILVGAFLLARPVGDMDITIPIPRVHVWSVKSVDTMKSSRDLALNKLNDPNFETVLDLQTQNIAGMGANYIGIATPYDDQFLPITRKWVGAARRHGLGVWFRGNFSSWEGWFGYEKNLTRDEHIRKASEFIANNPDLFVDGDIFTACPECENGGPGDPRTTTSPEEFRAFMIAEREAVDREFAKIGKKVATNYNSMNLDVAKVVFDEETVREMDHLIVVDHYVGNPEDLAVHVAELAKKTKSKVFLGEIGAPVKNITADMDWQQQADWADGALLGLAKNKDVIGINWWVNIGGETALFTDAGEPKPVAAVVEKYFKLVDLSKL